MFSNLILSKFKVAIIVVLLLLAGIISYFALSSQSKFDVLSIQKKLSAGNSALFQSDIRWIEEDGQLVGTLKIDKLKSNITYILQENSIETISLVGVANDFQDRIPCLNLVHLLSKNEVKNFYEVVLKDADSAKEGYNIFISNKLFIDYHQEETPAGLELHCKMYYVN